MKGNNFNILLIHVIQNTFARVKIGLNFDERKNIQHNKTPAEIRCKFHRLKCHHYIRIGIFAIRRLFGT